MRFLIFPVKAVTGISLFVMLACNPKARILQSPPHYNFSEVFSEKLDSRLQEISGLAWDHESNVFMAINDEQGILFFMDKETKVITTQFVFGDKGDYEDVAVLNGIPYILRSDGMITRFVRDLSGKTQGVEAGTIDLSGDNDFETLYSDEARKALVMMCKNCKTDDDGSVSAFAYYPDSIGFDNKPLFVIDAKKVEKLSPFKTGKFQPSAAAIHPVLQKLFIISAASHQLVICSLNGDVEAVYKLAASLFPQPEGIAFKQNGDLYIANEGIGKKASLLKFKFIDTTATPKKVYDKIGYNFSAPDDKMEMKKQLHEISGMAYIPGKNLILAENDEKGDIFTIDFKTKNDQIGKLKFGGKDDYEDIVYTDKAIYMLVSSGTIVEVQTKDSSYDTKDFKLDKDGKNEFETLYLDADQHSLIMLCKDCHKEKNEVRNAYRFDIASQSFSKEPAYIIDVTAIQKILNDDKAEFKPSAAAINPVTGKLFIVASVGKLLVIADKAGKVEQVIRLDEKIFNQPEGMTFAPNGDLYISNEGGEGVATILKFIYRG